MQSLFLAEVVQVWGKVQLQAQRGKGRKKIYK